VHSSSGAIRSTSAAVITPDCRKITPTEMASKQRSVSAGRAPSNAWRKQTHAFQLRWWGGELYAAAFTRVMGG
ncbi:hypothetical protein, partial [Streptomyces eurythermus]